LFSHPVSALTDPDQHFERVCLSNNNSLIVSEGLEGLRWVGVGMVHRRVIMGCILSVQGTGARQRPQTGVRTVHCKVQPTGISTCKWHVVDT
jgi:hypothetical protein